MQKKPKNFICLQVNKHPIRYSNAKLSARSSKDFTMCTHFSSSFLVQSPARSTNSRSNQFESVLDASVEALRRATRNLSDTPQFGKQLNFTLIAVFEEKEDYEENPPRSKDVCHSNFDLKISPGRSDAPEVIARRGSSGRIAGKTKLVRS